MRRKSHQHAPFNNFACGFCPAGANETVEVFMTRVFISSLFVLVACDGGENCGTCAGDNVDDCANSACDEPCDGDVVTIDGVEYCDPEPGYLNVSAAIMGERESAQVVIGGKVVGATDEPIELEPGTYTLALGDPENMSDFVGTDNEVPLHVTTTLTGDWENSTWIAAPVTVTIPSGETVTMTDIDESTPETSDDGLVLYYYAPAENPTWSCQWDGDDDVDTEEITYSDPTTLDLTMTDVEFISSVSFVDAEFGGQYYSGNFSSSSTAQVILDAEGNEYDKTYFCWAGDEDDDPRE